MTYCRWGLRPFIPTNRGKLSREHLIHPYCATPYFKGYQTQKNVALRVLVRCPTPEWSLTKVSPIYKIYFNNKKSITNILITQKNIRLAVIILRWGLYSFRCIGRCSFLEHRKKKVKWTICIFFLWLWIDMSHERGEFGI